MARTTAEAVPASEVPKAKKTSKQRTLHLIKSLDTDNDDDRTTISKKISWILRHGAKVAGVKMDEQGWVLISDLLKAEILDDIDEETLMQVIVDKNGKKLRYELKDTAEGRYIKAYSKTERKLRESASGLPVAKAEKTDRAIPQEASKGLRQDAPVFVPSQPAAATPAFPATPTGTPMGYPWGFFPPMMPFMNPFVGWPQVPPGKYTGRIKSFNSEKGFGFIECPQTFATYQRDVFLHKAQIGEMTPGTMVTFSCEVNKQGMPQAKDVAAFGAPPAPTPAGGKGGKGKGKDVGKGKGGGTKGRGKGGRKGKDGKEGKEGEGEGDGQEKTAGEPAAEAVAGATEPAPAAEPAAEPKAEAAAEAPAATASSTVEGPAA